ncbi:peptide chain release factor N(5)-glutamine methyltransferase [Pilimelia terevasa]|uniref:peptide chain release factor N(5)-glutamine methyltransferase n=1 Tax=Pilimelia terevasa TaxID=53372 RepID=UPI00166F1240|nr:peptide chain release factor N(5)-glutamine methyltransferase [Pilimelia terevasa]
MIAQAVRVLAAAALPSPRVDAELLAAYVLRVARGRLLSVDSVTGSAADRIRALAAARAGGAPLQHLTGRAAFRYLELSVGPGVFVPRPETELLVDWGLAALRDVAAPVVVDCCAGSGAIALAVAHELPRARVYAVEREPAALDWLRRNAAARAAAGDRPVTVVAGDVADPGLAAALPAPVDLLLANPPYVPAAVAVPADVRRDPAAAVFGGADGLDVIRPLVALAAAVLRPGGGLAVEHDDTHAAAVAALLRPAFADVAGHEDLAGRPRYTTGWRGDGGAAADVGGWGRPAEAGDTERGKVEG